MIIRALKGSHFLPKPLEFISACLIYLIAFGAVFPIKIAFSCRLHPGNEMTP